MGFTYALPDYVHDVSNPTNTTGTLVATTTEEIDEDADGTEEEPPSDANAYLRQVLGDEEDIEIVLNEEPPPNTANAAVLYQIELEETAELAATNDRMHQELVRSELARLLPDTNGKESTSDAFKQLSNHQAWFPLRSPSSSSPETDVDKAEAALFHEWSPTYNIDVATGPQSYHAFARAWNIEAANRFRAWSQGDEEVVQIRPKNREFLVQHYKDGLAYEALCRTAPRNDLHQLVMESGPSMLGGVITLKDTLTIG
ncbi:expressed unknown protein [Seminavis robusta]|uniref:Uncharacterized protein n=1 Tax=Seminavis robusta TaxID=568900 RepID=A0A9N8EN39_9STRA|nr:expressed unknown protein [Seminavis robusta]|eukprot:Sro1265_g257470.1 n/a (257) ;mRNA; r:11587-13018